MLMSTRRQTESGAGRSRTRVVVLVDFAFSKVTSSIGRRFFFLPCFGAESL